MPPARGPLACVCIAALLVAACGGDDVPKIQVSGSSTVEPISVRVAELLEDTGSASEINVDGPGTGDGFALFCDGQTDISDASRPIKDEETADCEANDIAFTELLVAQDGITVLVNPSNPLECINFVDLYALLGPESSDVDNWSDAAELAAELGSDTEFPDMNLDITAPGAESGTHGSFIEIVLEDIYDDRVESGLAEAGRDPIRNYAGQSDDNIIIQGIEGSNGGFGYVGFAFAENAGDGVKELAVASEPGGECVSASATSIADNTYPISRPLFIYVNDAKVVANPAIVEYVDFYLGEAYGAVEEVGYVFLDDDTKADTVALWQESRR